MSNVSSRGPEKAQPNQLIASHAKENRAARRTARLVGSGSAPACLIGLPAQESRDFELIVVVRVIHRRLPAMLVEALRSRTQRCRALRIFRPAFGRTRFLRPR